MIWPARYDLLIYPRVTFGPLEVSLTAAGQPVDATGWDGIAQVYRKTDRTGHMADLAITWISRGLGRFLLSAEDAVTQQITSPGFWDLLLIQPDRRDYWLQGRVKLKWGVSDDEQP